ncbi:uncharacterized protein [Macrobrachium rosenbergii]|uniref:uncharacterized protein isoform X2 n=1 Tax=Macrobrachium rosenbergii TaxID=79674 RepID=UPI0034D621EA
MRQASRLFVFLFLFSLTSSAQSESAVRNTSQGQPTVFRLPSSDTIVVGFRTEHRWPHIKYTISSLGEKIHEGKLETFEWTSQWTPFLLVSKEVIRSAFLEHFRIPAGAPRELDMRHLSVLSRAPVQWQMMTLPLKDHDLKTATPGKEVFLDLPEEDGVWVAVWNNHSRELRIELKLFPEQHTSRFLNINASEDWSIICINDKRILYGGDSQRLSTNGLKGRRLQMISNAEVHFQVFPVPLKSTDAAPPPPTTLFIAIGVVVTSAVILGSFLGCRFFWKRRNKGPTGGATSAMFTINNPSFVDEGVPTGEHFGAVSQPGLIRPSSSHDSENSLYGAVIPR